MSRKFAGLCITNPDEILIVCSILEIMEEQCLFASSFLIAAQDAFSQITIESADKPILMDVVIKIIASLESLDMGLREDIYVPAEYSYLNFLVSQVKPLIFVEVYDIFE